MRSTILALVLAVAGCTRHAAPPAKAAEPVPPAPGTTTPALLAAELAKPPAERPVVLSVGFHEIYQSGHVPGALDMGPAVMPEGRSALAAELQSLGHEREIVLYCGCCPEDHCPNIRPAMALARQLGFTNVKKLVIPRNFRMDWAKAGFPVER